jgi:high-affinity Fe2+/Pb2+ permease
MGCSHEYIKRSDVGGFLFLPCDLPNYMGAAMNETFMLYLFTRLDSFNGVLGFAAVVLFIASLIALWITLFETKLPFFNKIWWSFAVLMVLNIIVPTQKNVALILAGSTIMSIAKTDEAQRITSKSVRVVEQYLDALLKDKEKK